MAPRRSSEQPIIVRWLWDKCHLLDDRRAFVVEVPAERALGLLPEVSSDETCAYLEMAAQWDSLWPGTITKGHVTCVVSEYGHVVGSYRGPWFAYSNLWNGSSPLLRLGIRVADLAALQDIPDERIRKALDDDIRSAWCLDPNSWDGTELEDAQG